MPQGKQSQRLQAIGRERQAQEKPGDPSYQAETSGGEIAASGVPRRRRRPAS